MGALHDALDEAGYRGHKLERFLVRLLFCLFADDTGIFQPLGIFEEYLKDRTREDGADLGPMLSKLFEVLDTPEPERSKKLDADLARFDCRFNGELFHERLPLPEFSTAPCATSFCTPAALIGEKISPAIFGSLFQSVMDKVARQAGRPLHQREKHFEGHRAAVSDDLESEFARLKARRIQAGGGRWRILMRISRRPHFFQISACGLWKFFGHRLSRIA